MIMEKVIQLFLKVIFVANESHTYNYAKTICLCHYYYDYCLDGIAQDEEYFRIELSLFVIYTIFSIFGVIFAVICLLFNLWFRNQKYVYMLFTDSNYNVHHFTYIQVSEAWESVHQHYDCSWCDHVLYNSNSVWS